MVRLAPSSEVADRRLDAELLVDVLWAVAGPRCRVEHISASAGRGQMDVGVYVQADSQIAADRTVRELLAHATLTVPLLRGWDIRPP